MKLKLYQIDAFAKKVFEGNPAAICPLDSWLTDDQMQALAIENNLSETAFFVENDGVYDLRWFTPGGEVNLCGHATLAAAYVLYNILGVTRDKIQFNTKSGLLSVSRQGSSLCMDFPVQIPTACPVPAQITEAFATKPLACMKHDDLIVVLENEEAVQQADPDAILLAQIDCRGIIITAVGNDYDFVLRWFGPRMGVKEDPVTGSAFTQIASYWAEQLGKNKFSAKQISARGGEVECELQGDRVLISGSAVKYLEGTFEI